jgi:hypothetical protein
MQPLEEVDGVSKAVVAQGQVIPSDAIAAGDGPPLLVAYAQDLSLRRALAWLGRWH